ncbi:hypothetical protein [Marinimicrobium sp. ABcell2]|uniref:hypothetical protein n=1 Tax=Marinimicrobium sp. ABcell2 TaxID=3069751 RepID=UPI0027B2AD54|nr:hypothetical protein [Marinimicrobium sp. ABcell2]MDQ2076063.1 hypothetical protein [Marinimicrobium sp. ABcell2]
MIRPQNALGVNFNPTEQLQEKLIAEITGFERQLDSTDLHEQSVDFSMIQTYKELIQSRRSMLEKLPRAF